MKTAASIYLAFLIESWLCSIYSLRNAPTDVELWGRELE